MIEYLFAGITLGLYSGLSPGPLLVLVISQTLKHGYKEGIKVSFAPVITDLPIIILSLLFLSVISEYTSVIGLISIIGGAYLGYLAYESFKTNDIVQNIDLKAPKSIKKGITVNLLNPSPYLFWISIGGPLITQAYLENPLSSLLFLIGFYGLLIGSKIALACTTEKSREFLTGRLYIYIMQVIGVILIIFALYFVKQGLQLIIS